MVSRNLIFPIAQLIQYELRVIQYDSNCMTKPAVDKWYTDDVPSSGNYHLYPPRCDMRWGIDPFDILEYCLVLCHTFLHHCFQIFISFLVDLYFEFYPQGNHFKIAEHWDKSENLENIGNIGRFFHHYSIPLISFGIESWWKKIIMTCQKIGCSHFLNRFKEANWNKRPADYCCQWSSWRNCVLVDQTCHPKCHSPNWYFYVNNNCNYIVHIIFTRWRYFISRR